MSAPKRWLEEGGSATPFERDLLRSAPSMDPPPGARQDVWAALLAQLPPVPPGAGPGDGGGSAAAGGKAAAGKGATAAATAGKAAAAGKTAALAKGGVLAGAAGAGILKSALIGAGSAVALLATYSASVTMGDPQRVPQAPPAVSAVTSSQAAAPRPRSIAEQSAAAPQPAAPEPALSALPAAPERRPSASSSSSAAPAPVEPAVERATMLREEANAVGEARDALRRGDASGALTRLDEIRARFPAGVLGQEREALTIEALARSGRRGDAAARAAAFLQAHPDSVLAERIRVFAQPVHVGGDPQAPGQPAP